MWTDHPHVPALERDWLLYVEKPLAVPFLSIIILLLVTKNRTLNTSPRDVKWHRSLSIVNQCVCFFAPKKCWFDVWNSTMALGRWGRKEVSSQLLPQMSTMSVLNHFPKVFCGPSEYLEVLIITLGISRSKGWLSSQNTSETRDPTGRVAPTPVGLVQLNGRLEGSGWLIQRMVRGWFGARWCWDSNFWILI